LAVWLRLELLLDLLKVSHLLAQACDLVLQAGCLCFQLSGLRTIGGLQGVQIPLDALLDLLLALVDLTLGEVAITRIDCLELAAVNRDGSQLWS
jgi:hypothetical protein